MSKSDRKPRDKSHVLRAIEDGLESAPEISDDLSVSIVEVDFWLAELVRDGLINREGTPTYQGRSRTSRPYHRYKIRATTGASA